MCSASVAHDPQLQIMLAKSWTPSVCFFCIAVSVSIAHRTAMHCNWPAIADPWTLHRCCVELHSHFLHYQHDLHNAICITPSTIVISGGIHRRLDRCVVRTDVLYVALWPGDPAAAQCGLLRAFGSCESASGIVRNVIAAQMNLLARAFDMRLSGTG